MALSPDGRRVLSGGNAEGAIRLLDVETGKELTRSEKHVSAVWSLAFAPDGRHALSCGWDTTVRLWRLPDLPPAKP